MTSMQISDELITKYVEQNISDFHQKRLEKLSDLKLNSVLKRKNPYLFKAKSMERASLIVTALLDAYLSSQEETLFGEFLECLAIYINGLVFQGRKSSTDGIDLEFEKQNIRYIVSIKSGPNWGNSSQITKMKENFTKAKKIIRTNSKGIQIEAVNGCCYGTDNNPDKGDYFKYCGAEFWSFITGDPDFYLKIIEPLGIKAKRKNSEFMKKYDFVINKFTLEFTQEFCKPDGELDWVKLVRFNSGYGKKK